MQNSKPSIDLLVPGLLGPIPALREIDITPTAALLEKCLSRATLSDLPALDFPSTLLQLFSVSFESQTSLPTAPWCRLSDGGMADDAYWIQASPVHLRPDGDGLLLFDAGVLEITLDEANQLADSFRQHFSDMPWQLEVHSAQRWYLRLEQEPDLATSSLVDVAGRNINSFLPTGADSSAWRSILNEVQMLFYMAKVNMLREGRGQLTVNGLWLHGGGYLHSIQNLSFDSVYANEPLVRGMAQSAGLEPKSFPADSSELPVAGKSLVVADLLERPVLDADPVGWVEALELFDAWLQPLVAEVKSKRLEYLNIYPCNGTVYRIDTRALRRFWRPGPAIKKYIS